MCVSAEPGSFNHVSNMNVNKNVKNEVKNEDKAERLRTTML